MKKLQLVCLLIGFAGATKAQDLHYTQIMQSPNLLNPGAVGVYDGWERVAIHHRNQWLGGSTSYMSTGINADATLMKDVYRPKAHLGFGLHFYNDLAGASKFGSQIGGLTVSGILPIGSGSQLSLGIQGSFGSRRGDISRVMFDSQWGGNAYDPLIISGESNLSTFTYLDASAGLFYQFDGGQTSFARNNDVKFQFGLAAYHANAPQLRYRTGSSEKLERKYVAMFNYTMDIPNTLWSFDAQGAQFVQGGHFETLLGLILKRRFSEGSKQTGFKRDASIGFGCYTRIKDAIMPTIQVEYKGFKFGLSYDATLSAYRRSLGIGSMELSVSFVNQHHALFKTRRSMR